MRTEQYNLPASELPGTEGEISKKEGWQHSFHWRVLRIMSEFTEGWQFLSDLKKTVTFFGSAKTAEGSPWYEQARKLANKLAEDGFDIVTGGGPGIMEAANRGAYEAFETASGKEKEKTGNSIGLNIKLLEEQRINKYVRRSIAFHYFFIRKVMLSYYAQAYVYFPGGFGTLDEMFELVTLIQTKKVPAIPIVLVGKEYWSKLADFIEEVVFKEYQAIDEDDKKIYQIVDNAEEAYKIIKGSPERKEF